MAGMALPTGLPADHLRHGVDGKWRPSLRTTPTDIGAYLWSILAAESLGIIRAEEADRRLDLTLESLTRLERMHGHFLNKYDPLTGETLVNWPGTHVPVRPFLSTVDNGWLAASLMMVRNTRPRARDRAEALLKPMDFGFYFEPFDAADPRNHSGQLHGGYWPDNRSFAAPYGMLNTEPRMASYIGIALGHVPREHYYRMFRTPPMGLFPQAQTPRGEPRRYLGVEVFEGHYTYRGLRIVPSWGGSMFEAMMVPLFVPEAQWAPRSWGLNHRLYVRAQIEHGLDEAHYGYWGFSPADNPDSGYRTYGVDAIGASPDGYSSNNDNTLSTGPSGGPRRVYSNGVVTPHASFLALEIAPREAMANLRALAKNFPIYDSHGFRDSVNVSTGKVSGNVLALDQGMILAAIANALRDDVMRHAFSDGAIETAIKPLISPEEFTVGDLPIDRPDQGGQLDRSRAVDPPRARRASKP